MTANDEDANQPPPPPPPFVDDPRELLPVVPRGGNATYALAHVLNLWTFYFCVKTAWEWHDLPVEHALAFYGVYHREPRNQLLHFVGVPVILWTLLIFAAHVPFTHRLPVYVLPGIRPHYVSWATLWVLLYTRLYLRMDLVGGTLYALVLYGMYKTAVQWTYRDQKRAVLSWLQESKSKHSAATAAPHWTGTGKLLLVALALHVASWVLQIVVGHARWEGAQPASMASLGGALTTAPLFAFYEGIWYVGLRPKFQQRVLAQVAVFTAELCADGANMRVCAQQ